MPAAKCYCGSYHRNVQGFKDHFQAEHGLHPDGQAIDSAILRAAGDA